MANKLTVIVTCTDRKTLRPEDSCRARSLPSSASLEVRHDLWRERLGAATVRRRVGALYAGEAWSRTGHLLAAARRAGFDPELWVASAGLGLVPADCEAPGYAATFSRGHADSVATTRTGLQEWWRRFSQVGGRRLAEVATGGSVLIVVSSAYARALRYDFDELGGRGGDVLIVGGVSQLTGLQRLTPDIGLRSILGGTASSLNPRMAEAWLLGLDRPVLTDPARRARWNRWAAVERRDEEFERQPVSDTTVVSYIRALRQAQPSIGYSTALKQFRATGRACEQRRFAGLFVQAVSE